jgi:putative serine protease PepD
MSDDLFWPPLSGDGEDSTRETSQPEVSPGATADDGHGAGHGSASVYPGQPTAAYPTEPLTGGGTGEPPSAAGRSRKAGAVAVVGATAFVFGAGGIAVGAAVVHHDNSSDDSSLAAAPVASGDPSALTTSPKSDAGIAAKVLPSVVSINVTGTNESDTGSGIVLKSNGYILTNNHVVAAAEGGSGTVSVSFNDGSTSGAKIVGTDSLDDLAVIKVAKSGLTAAILGNSSAIQVGDPVLAIGSPLGLTGTVTSGIVSALNRPVQTQEETQPQQTDPFGLGQGGSGGSTTATPQTVIDAIQTDAAINPGNSGGALVDAVGQVIGINSAIASLGETSLTGTQSGNIGVGFAIPINQARTVANELITTGKALHPLLGVSLEDSTGKNGVDNAVVHTVTAGGPAAKAGIKDGDVITAVDGAQTEGTDAVIAAIRSHQPGQQVTVTIQRSGSTRTVTATLTTESSTQG